MEKDIEIFTQQAREIYDMHKPFGTIGARATIVDLNNYLNFKRKIKEKIFNLDFPEIEELEKWKIFESLLSELEDLIENKP